MSRGRTLPLSRVRVSTRTFPGVGPMASLDYAYRRLVNTLGPERVARSEFERMVYSHDFASLPKIALLQWKLYPDFVALPQTTEEVAALVKLSDESLLQITPRGGGTGWYGGSVPNRGGVLVDMRKMNHIVAFDPDGRTVTVEAGATWKDLEDFVESKGFALPIVPVNAIGSTVGGAINSGSTGFGAPRGGSLRDAIARLLVVLPDGSLLKTASEADVDGHLANLTPLFFGAEGTLGIIAEATLRVVPKPESSKAIAYAFPSLAASARFLKEIVDSALIPYHAALASRDHFVFERALRPDSPDPADIALVALQGSKDEVADQERTGDGLAAKENGTKLVPAITEQLWRDRSNNYSARRLSRGLVPSYNLIPVSRLPESVDRAVEIRDKLKLNGAVQAFLVDSTTAALVPYVLMDDTRPSGGTALGFVKRMGDAAFKMDGHSMGLGLFLVFNLRKMHGRATSFISAVKVVFDPRKKINGGKTLEVWTKYPWPGLRAIPPPGMAVGLEIAAVLRRAEPTRGRFVRAYEHPKGGRRGGPPAPGLHREGRPDPGALGSDSGDAHPRALRPGRPSPPQRSDCRPEPRAARDRQGEGRRRGPQTRPGLERPGEHGQPRTLRGGLPLLPYPARGRTHPRVRDRGSAADPPDVRLDRAGAARRAARLHRLRRDRVRRRPPGHRAGGGDVEAALR